jgi:hypothetical protein
LGYAITLFHGAAHVGLLYRTDEDVFRLSHFAWHDDLRDELFDGAYICGPSGLDVDTQDFVAGLLIKIARNKNRIPYAFDSQGCAFDRQTLEYVQGPSGHGLTCATFIMAVFAIHAMPFFLVDTWPPLSELDKTRFEGLLKVMRREGVPEEHVRAVESNPASRRFSPEQVAAGVQLTPPAASYDEIRPLTEEISAELRSRHPQRA